MLDLLPALVPLALAAALQPPQFIAFVLLLQGPYGTVNGWAYFTGMGLFRLFLGLLLWLLFSALEETMEATGSRFELFAGLLLTVLGIGLLLYALRRQFFPTQEEEGTAVWMDRIRSADPRQAAIFGAMMIALDPKDWLIDLAAVDLIVAADLNSIGSLIAYLGYILVAQLLLLALLLLTLLNPDLARRVLDRLGHWLERNEQLLSVGVSFVLGLFLLVAGIQTVF